MGTDQIFQASLLGLTVRFKLRLDWNHPTNQQVLYDQFSQEPWAPTRGKASFVYVIVRDHRAEQIITRGKPQITARRYYFVDVTWGLFTWAGLSWRAETKTSERLHAKTSSRLTETTSPFPWTWVILEADLSEAVPESFSISARNLLLLRPSSWEAIVQQHLAAHAYTCVKV